MSDLPIDSADARPLPPGTQETAGHLRWRYLKDKLARYTVWVGGLSVIGALMLIFFYLLSEVLPLFGGAHFEARDRFTLPGSAAETLYVISEEQGEVGMRVDAAGGVVFMDLHTGQTREQTELPAELGDLHSVIEVAPENGLLAAIGNNGTVLLFRHHYRISYPDDKRFIDPDIEYPYGEEPVRLMDVAPLDVAVRDNEDQLAFYGLDSRGTVYMRVFDKVSSFLSDSIELEEEGELRFTPGMTANQVLVDPLLDWMYLIDRQAGRMAFYDLDGAEQPRLVQTAELDGAVLDADFLAGGVSVVVVGSSGVISQWFPARNAQGDWKLARIRDFSLPKGVKPTALGIELRRRVFAVGTQSGRLLMFHATAESEVADEQFGDAPIQEIRFSPRAKLMLLRSGDQLSGYDVENEHPEVSVSGLWGKVWYEGYEQPQYQWQSSAANADFEPKFSLTPLAFGTIKAAFYAMLFAIPLAILGAIFTANFMSAKMRQVVKPTVELMEALPTVILGFLAGLWLAPFIETHLAGVFVLLVLLPLSIPIFGYLWLQFPKSLRFLFPAGWEALLLLPVIMLVTWLSFLLAQPIEIYLFQGNMQTWMDRELGIGYDQRNSLVVGIAMGVAVIPTIFSITEDAIFSVPKHLSLGSLALGATPWQTLVGVVLPTASPGIFSAVMIGMGRAVGETMIVLMATGNTPVMDFSIFEGMRTLSANIAVEMPESEVGSTHYRLLFMAGLVLFLFTFVFNTLAEVVRQRLRQKYASI